MKLMLVMLLLLPMQALAQWSAVWADVEAFVNSTTNAPPQYSTSDLIADLKAAVEERLDAMGQTFDLSAIPETNNWASIDQLQAIDDALAYMCGHAVDSLFVPTNYFNASGICTNWRTEMNVFTNTIEEFDGCTNGVVDVDVEWSGLKVFDTQLPGWTFGDHLEASGAGHKFNYRAFGSTAEICGFKLPPMSGPMLLGELVYTITDVAETNDVPLYTASWVWRDHGSLSLYTIPTNSFAGSNAWVKLEVHLNSTNYFNTATNDLPACSVTSTGDVFIANWWQASDRWYADQDMLNVKPYTNSVSVTGADGAQINAAWPWSDLSGAGVSSGLVTQTSTNLSDFTHLGDAITISWTQTNTVLVDTEQPARGLSVYSLYQRKLLLCAMTATDGRTNDLFKAQAYSDWVEVGTNATVAGAVANIAASTPTSYTSINDTVEATYLTGLNCDFTPGTNAFGADAGAVPVRFGVTNLTTNATCTVDIYGLDQTEEFHADSGIYWAEWDSYHANAVRGGIYHIESHTNITGSADWTVGNLDLPSAPAGEPGLGDAAAGYEANLLKGFQARIINPIMRWNFAYK